VNIRNLSRTLSSCAVRWLKSSSSVSKLSRQIAQAAFLLCLSGQVWSDPIIIEAASSWQLRGTANAVVTAGDIVYIGGNFTEIYDEDGGSLPRMYLAALNRHTGEPIGFAPNLDGEVWALAISSDRETLYVGGSFQTAESLPRRHFAAYDVQTGALTTLVTPSPNGALRAIAIANEKIYLAGLFTKVGSEDRSHVAAFNADTGELDATFTATPNARVRTLAVDEDQLWLGGDFYQINGIRQRGVGAVDLESGSLKATDEVSYPVIALAVSDTQLFIAGGGPGGKAASFNRESGREQWEITSDGNFQAVDVGEGQYVYFGGHYEAIEGNRQIDRLTRHEKSTGRTDLGWLPRLNGIRSINAVDVTPDGLHIGGDFSMVHGDPHEGFATLPKRINDEPVTQADRVPSPVNTVQGTLDVERRTGPRWVRLRVNTNATALHSVNVSWDSGSDVRFNVFNADGTRMTSSTVQGANPAVWTGRFDADEQYYIGLWTMDGIANYTASITRQ
jgi:outer membrane protein assembly factor BamB